jgi:progesterone-induced-blocking factor 1
MEGGYEHLARNQQFNNAILGELSQVKSKYIKKIQ